jgi:hypothetical protein
LSPEVEVSVSVETGVELGRSKGNARPSFLALLFAPDRGMARQALAGRAIGFFLVAWLCSILLGAALAYRIDATDVTMMKIDKSGQLKGMSDRQVADEIKNAERVAVVIDVAKGVTKTPVQLGLSCLAILALTWFLRGKIKGSAVAPVAGAALLPGAIADLLDAGTAFRHTAIPPDGTELAPRTLADVLDLTAHPLMGSLHKLGESFDFFSLWSAVMIGFGLVVAGQLPRRRALVGTMVAWVCYRLLTHVAGGGGPGGG